MQTVTLGRTGLTVSRLCFGTLTLGPLQHNLPPEQGAELLRHAFDLGINFIDTAQYYENYPALGLALCGRDDVLAATKTYAYDRAEAICAVEQARRALGRDIIDIFLLHEQESEHTLRGHAEALDTLRDYQSRGVIRAVGLSTHHVAGVRAATAAGLDVVHPLVNLTGLGIADGTRQDMEAAISAARAAGLGVYTMKALGGGTLFRSAPAALHYAMEQGDSVAVGMCSTDEVEANVRFFTTGSFAPGEEQRLTDRRRTLSLDHQLCTGCGACTAACAAGALTVTAGRAVWSSERCVLCGYCAGRCPQFCIRII